MKRLLSLLATASMLAAMLTLSLGVVPVAAAGPDCGSGQVQATWYEDSGYGGHNMDFCFIGNNASGQLSIANLTQRPAFCVISTQCGGIDGYNCHRGVIQPAPDSYTWNDCISSLHVWLPSCHYGLSFYENESYSGLLFTAWGPSGGGRVDYSSLGTTAQNNDKISSMYQKYRSVCSA